VSVGEAALTTDPALAIGRAGAAGVAEVRAAAQALGAVMDRLDPAVVTVDDAMAMLEVFTQIERMGAAGKTVIAKRATDSERLLRHKGYRDGVDYLARATDSTVGEAVAVLATANALEGLDATTDAVKAGGMSPRRAVAVAAAARANPDTEQEMLAIAETGSLREVQERSRQICRDASTETDEQRAVRLRRRRSVRHGIDADSGEGWGRWRLPPAEHAELVAELNRHKQVFFDDARRKGCREGDDAYLADALVDLARHPANPTRSSTPDTGDPGPDGPSGPGPGAFGGGDEDGTSEPGWRATGRTRWNQKVLVRVDDSAAQRGHPVAGERCEIAHVGPISAAEVRDLLASDAAKAVVVTDPHDHTHVVAVAHLGHQPLDPATLLRDLRAAVDARGVDVAALVHTGRHPTAAQTTAIEWLSGGHCQIHGCTSGTGRLEIDHIEPWADTHRTELHQLALLCGHHHDLKTHHHWTVGPLHPNGTRHLTPPPPPEPPGDPPPGSDPPDTSTTDPNPPDTS
jgi:hypothetical protein